MLNQVTITAVSTGNTGTAAVSATANMRILGYCVRESSGTPALANLTIRHGATNSDTVLAPITLLASTSLVAWFGPQGIPVPSGIYVDRTTGNSTVSLYTAIDN